MRLWNWVKDYGSRSIWHKVQLVGFLLLAIIIVFELFFFAGIWYTSLQSGLTLYVEPVQEKITTLPSEEYEIAFDVRVTNAPFCTQTCQYTLTDQRTKEAQQGVITGDADTISTLHTSPDRGVYESGHQLVLTCQNHFTQRCQRTEDSATQTALVRVEHTRTDVEQEAYDALLENKMQIEEVFSNTQSRVLGILGVEDVRAGTPRQQALIDIRNLQEQFEALRIATANEEFVIAEQLTTPVQTPSIEMYDEVAVNEQSAIAAYDEVLNTEQERSERVMFISEQDFRAQFTALTQAREVRNNFYSMQSEAAREQFVRASQLFEANLSIAEIIQERARTKQRFLCEQNVTECPGAARSVDSLLTATEVLESSCTFLAGLDEQYESINQTYTPTTQQQEICARRSRALPEMPPALTPRLEERPFEEVQLSLSLPQKQCCANGVCVTCGEERRTPIIFVHGHSFAEKTSPEYSLQAFSTMALTLQEEGWMHAGAMFPRERVERGSLANSPGGVSFVTTYYYDGFEEDGDMRFVTRKTERIETYAIRLRETIRNVKEVTGQDEVIIVAHSMGGLVTRSYLEIFGEGDVAGVIMIGTPNQGVSRLVERLCPVIGADFECDDMRQNSLYLRRLSQAPAPSIPVMTIAGVGCDGAFDGIVEEQSVYLSYAQNEVITGMCPTNTRLLHNRMLIPDEYPEVYALVVDFLHERS